HFTCSDPAYSFSELLKKLDRNPSTLRLPGNTNQEAEGYLKMGYVPAPHYLRQGARTVSWYHGPLTTGPETADISLPVPASDQLLRYYESNGMFDISYAAAWELGRLLALRDKSFSTSLYRWKRTHVQTLRKAEQVIAHESGHLPETAGTVQDPQDLPEVVKNWFDDIGHLKGVPFNYLVPDERMLPIESIRFFRVDRLWMECLLDGAFSIGRVTTDDHQRDRKIRETISQQNEQMELSGFLMRSEAVSGWPGLMIEGYNCKPQKTKSQDSNTPQEDINKNPIPESNKLPLLRMERLSKNVLLCLFSGNLQTVDIHLKPETLHFGVTAGNGSYNKELRDKNGIENKNYTVTITLNNNRTIKMTDLISGINSQYTALSEDQKDNIDWNKTPTSAEFALQMIEGVQKVRFISSG
ncbi:MAG: hypothetical protein GTO45_25855, partial [Candidatus Aminicenantes bacterium]|nr:hypothetical protein [Candidatus Aminicenantes bacterium]NIM82163.1 hypothetical protein [Candidatus Aminicenantes bacterium]NIN21564.1 hypothetical protein [Candidatus Aminicenantes bacterium]NIN88194.1 hypothetical protein [Candidatus Aminicenantes bacterium]NIO84550.1 hypothetical protein [Candidatus Aminicenantes bacterium]